MLSRFRDDIMRIVDEKSNDDEISFISFYNLMNDKFMECLDYLHGRELNVKMLAWGHNLKERFIVLKYTPDEGYIERCFHLFLCKLEQRAAEIEFKEQKIVDVFGDPDEWFERIVVMKRYLETQQDLIFEFEKELEEEASSIISRATSRRFRLTVQDGDPRQLAELF
jgi:hypothetical protein